VQEFDFCVFIGRFSIFHNAHLEILEHAFKISKKVIVVIGSAGSSRTVKNPWTALERREMILSAISKDNLDRVTFIDMKDYLYNNNLWVSILQEKLNNATNDSGNVALIGYESDETSDYLKLFPQFQYIEHGTKYDFHATNIRDFYFSHDLSYKNMVPAGVISFLDNFQKTPEFSSLKQEKNYIDKYKASWSAAPFPPTFVTVDSLVLKSGHILIVERDHNPGKGLLALPGGFINPKEKLQDAALRELKEETGIKVNIPELRKAIVDAKVFDDPARSLRGRVLSHTFFIDLGSGTLPKVKGGDDARLAYWLPLSDYYTMEEKFFEDHFHIIRSMISKY
jgi:bifunctional NMN adenylyltransferase/nudix hydrolase